MNKLVSIKTALTLHQQGQLEKAEAMYKQILLAEPQQFDALQLLATIALQRNNFEAAIELFDQALKINPSFADALNNRGSALKNLKRYEEALDGFDCALRIDPNFAMAHFNRGNTLFELKRYEEALDSYNCSLKIKPDYVDAHQNRSNTLYILNDHQKASDSLPPFDREILAQAWPTLLAAEDCRDFDTIDRLLASAGCVALPDGGSSRTFHLSGLLYFKVIFFRANTMRLKPGIHPC